MVTYIQNKPWFLMLRTTWQDAAYVGYTPGAGIKIGIKDNLTRYNSETSLSSEEARLIASKLILFADMLDKNEYFSHEDSNEAERDKHNKQIDDLIAACDIAMKEILSK